MVRLWRIYGGLGLLTIYEQLKLITCIKKKGLASGTKSLWPWLEILYSITSENTTAIYGLMHTN